MTEYVSYLVKVGNGYLFKKEDMLIMGNRYEITLSAKTAYRFTKDDAVDVAKRYGGNAVGLLPVLISEVNND